MSTSYCSKRTPKDFNAWRRKGYGLARWGLWLYFKTTRGLKVYGRENLPPPGVPFVVAANHVSNLDPPLVGVAVFPQKVAFLAKKELFERPPLSWILDWIGCIAVDRDKVELSTIRSAKAALTVPRWGLGVFPEGTRVKEGEPVEIKKGVAFFARAAKCPIVPVAVVHGPPPQKRLIAEIGPVLPYCDEPLEATTKRLMGVIEALRQQGEARLVADAP